MNPEMADESADFLLYKQLKILLYWDRFNL